MWEIYWLDPSKTRGMVFRVKTWPTYPPPPRLEGWVDRTIPLARRLCEGYNSRVEAEELPVLPWQQPWENT